MRRLAPFAAAGFLACSAMTQAAADPAAVVRLGTHPGYGRVVFEFPAITGFSIERLDNLAILQFDGAGDVPNAPGGTRNVTAVRGGAGQAMIELSPGVRLRSARIGNRVVVDVLDAPHLPVARKPADTLTHEASLPAAPVLNQPVLNQPVLNQPAPIQPAPRAPVARQSLFQPVPAPAPTPDPRPAPAAPEPASPGAIEAALPAKPAPAPDAPPVQGPQVPGPLALAASRAAMPPGIDGSAVLLPFASKTAAAAFRRGGVAWAVFDERRSVDLAALQGDKLLGAAAVHLLTDATAVRLPLPDTMTLSLTRQPEGWVLAAIPAATPAAVTTPAPHPIIPAARDGRLLLPTPTAGAVVVVPEPDTGEILLVGVVREPAGVPVTYQQPQFILQPSWQGVLVEPLSDDVAMRSSRDGFVLETSTKLPPPPSAAQALSLAAFLTRRFDFPADPPATLMRRLQAQIASGGAAPPLSRALPRIAAAQTMIALGMGPEAQAVLRLTVEEDPREAANPDAQGLAAIAALLSGRPNETAGLDNPALLGTDEVALWRAVRAAQRQDGSPEAAAIFAATAPLILAYPDALQNRLLPLAVETMAESGQTEAADAMLAKRPDDPRLTLARAMRAAARGETGPALAAYDALAQGRDRLVSARAATRATLLRLATGALTPAAAAAALESQFLDWRGDNRELDLRLRVASLRGQAGAWRPAFDLLRETASLYPEAAGRIDAARTDLLGRLLTGPAADAVPAIDLVSLAEENAELVASVAPARMARLLADKLVALELPRRAAPVLERMMAAASGESKATLGVRLAAIRFAAADDAGAAAALAGSDGSGLPAPLQAERVLLGARITAHAGQPGVAAAALAALDSAAADDLRATLLTDAQDWRGAERAMQDLANRIVPAEGPLGPAEQDTLLRLATAQQRAGDTAALLANGKSAAARMTPPRADMFRLLTATPIEGIGDLRRASSEIALARSIPTALSAIGTR